MAVDQRKRQRKIAKNAKKQKARQKAVARVESGGIGARLRDASSAPILHCRASDDIWTEGIGSVLISRRLASGNVAFGMFLVDLYCLGVKDAFADIMPRPTYDTEIYSKMLKRKATTNFLPADVRKLVEGGVEYAHDLGLSPHADYRKAWPIFGDIDASESTRQFEFGKNGKPMFVAGPYDTPDRCRRIIGTLTECVGTDGFHYFLPLGGTLEAQLLATEELDELDAPGESATIRLLGQ